MINGKPYSLDLVEAGIELNPYFDLQIMPDADAVALIREKMPQAGIETLFGKKAAEIRGKSELLYLATMKSLDYLRFAFVGTELVDINDASSNLRMNPNSLKQAAVRNNGRVQIDRTIFNAMDLKNRVALIYHELFYAMQSPTQLGYVIGGTRDGNELKYLSDCIGVVFAEAPRDSIPNSDETRQVVGEIFNSSFQNYNPSDFVESASSAMSFLKVAFNPETQKIAAKALPVWSRVIVKYRDEFVQVAGCPFADQELETVKDLGLSQLRIAIENK